MRIVQLVTQLEAGGAQGAAILLARELARRGHETEAWFLYEKRAAHRDVPNLRVFADRRPNAIEAVRVVARLMRRLREWRPDALVTHTHYANVIGQLAAHACGVPMRIAVQQNPVTSYPAVARLADRILGTLGTYSVNVAVSDSVVDSAATYPRGYRRRLTTIHNGVTVPALDASRDEVRTRWGLPLDAPLLVNVGRLHPQKNQRRLVESLAALPGVHLAILGEGELRETLERLVAERALDDRVHLLGELPWRDGLAVVAAADVFVFPSLFEGLSLAIVEGMGQGRPIVASDIPSIREAVADAAILVEPTDVDALARAVRQVLDSPELATRLSERARARARHFSLSGMVDAYEALLA